MASRFYRIGEVAERTGVPQHVLRYWEDEFAQLRPTKARTGQRLYKDEDIAIIERIRTLLYDHRYTIEGARQVLSRKTKEPELAAIDTWIRELRSAQQLFEHGA